MELLAGGRDAAVAGRARPRHPGRREDPLLAHAAPGQARALELRAAGGRRRPRSADRAVRHPAGRRRRGAHGRQRRRPQALAPRAAVRRADRARLRPRRAARGPAGGRPRPHRRRRRAGRPPRWPRSASRARRAPGARSARRARAPSRARSSRSTARTRCSCSPTPTCRARCAAPRGRRSPTRASAAARSSACSACPRSTIASWPGSCRPPEGCAWATRRTLRPRSGRSSTASASRGCARWSTRPSAPARRCTAAAPQGEAHFAPAVLSGVTAAMRLAREEVPGPVLAVEAVGDGRAGRRARQRDDLRARRVGVDGRPLQGRAHRPRAARGDGVDERPPGGALGAPDPVGRRRRRGHRARPRRHRPAHVRRTARGDVGPADRATGVVVSLRRRRSSAPLAPSPACAARATATASAPGAATAWRCCV